MRKLLLVILLLLFINVQAQIEAVYSDFTGSTALNGAAIGVCFIDVADGNVVFESNATQFFYPASIQKTIITASALQLLGSSYQYKTSARIYGEIENGVLNGNLVLEGGGDPTTNSKHFNNDYLAHLLKQLENRGIHTIKGKVLVNGETEHNTPQTWLFEDIGNYYGVAPQIFNYKENMYTISFQQVANGQTPSIQKIDIPVPYKFDLKLQCSSKKKGDHSFIMGAPFSVEREIVGTITAGTGTFKVKGANAHPFYSFKEELAKHITINDEDLNPNREGEALGAKSSNELSTIVKLTNHESINLFAEGILNTMGLTFQSEYTTTAGISVVEDLISQSDADGKQIILKDGSGLSRLNAMTPSFAANWMCDFYENKDFVQSLPISGTTGTMRYLNHAGIKGKIQAKSGSAEGVVNYAGYVYLNNGKTYAFSIFVNNGFQSKYSIRREIGEFLERIL